MRQHSHNLTLQQLRVSFTKITVNGFFLIYYAAVSLFAVFFHCRGTTVFEKSWDVLGGPFQFIYFLGVG
jgi:hypothetical protein